jgi:hypothetical protein
MMLQYTCAARGGRTERVRRKRYAANQPKRVVYVSWKAAGYERASCFRLGPEPAIGE